MYSLNDITNGCVKVEPPDKTSYSGPRNQIPFTGDILVVKEEKTDTPWNGIHQETTSLSGVSDYQVPSLAEMSTQADVMNIQISNVQGAPSNQVVFSDKITGTQIEDNGSTGDGSNPEMQSKFDYVFQEKMPVVEQYHEGQLFKRMISQEKMYPVETGTRSPIDQSGFLKRIPLAETAEQEKELPHRINTQEGVSSPKLNHHAYADTSQTSFSTFPVSYQYSLPDEYQRDEATPSYQFDAGNGSPEIGVPYQINTTVTASSDKNSYTVPLDYQDTNMPASSDMNSHTAVPLNHTGTDMVAPSDMSYTTGTVNQKDANMSASSDMSSHTAVPLNHMGAEIVAPSDMSYMTVPVNHKDTSMSASSNMNSHTAVPLNHRKTNMPASSDMSSHTEVPLNHTGTNMVFPSDMSYTTVAVNHKDSNMFASSDMSYTTVAVNHKDANMFASSDMSSHTGVPLNHRETNMLAASDMSYTTVAVNHKDANMPASSDVSSRMALPLNYTGTDMVAPSDMSYMTVPLYQRDTQEEMPASMVNNVRYQPASYQVEVSSYHGVHTPHESLKVQQVHQRQIYDVGPAKGQRGSTCCDCCCHSSPQSESYYLPTFGLESQRPSVIMVPVSWNNTASGISHMPLKVNTPYSFHSQHRPSIANGMAFRNDSDSSDEDEDGKQRRYFRMNIDGTTARFKLTKEDWERIPINTFPSGGRLLSGDWTRIFLTKVKESNPWCSLRFKNNHVRSENSRKIHSAVFFRGGAECKRPECNVKVRFVIQKEKGKYVDVTYVGNVCHNSQPGGSDATNDKRRIKRVRRTYST